MMYDVIRMEKRMDKKLVYYFAYGSGNVKIVFSYLNKLYM